MVPLPGVLFTSMEAWCISTIFFTIESPRPLPSLVRVRDLSALKKRSKMCTSSSEEMPMPLSVMLKTACFPCSLNFRQMLPLAGVNFMLLVSRLSQTWFIRSGSAFTMMLASSTSMLICLADHCGSHNSTTLRICLSNA